MRVGGVRVRRDDRPVRDDHALFDVPLPDELRDVELGWAIVYRVADAPERLLHDRPQCVRGCEVRPELLFVPALRGVLQQVCGGHDLYAEQAHQLQRAGVYARYARKCALWRILHCYALRRSQHVAELGGHVLSADEERGLDAQMCEAPLINVADQQLRRGIRGNPEPARAGYIGDTAHRVPEDGVHIAIVVEQPAADTLSAQVLLRLRYDRLNGHYTCLRGILGKG